MAKDKLIYASAARKAILDADPKLAYCIDNIPGVDAVEVVHGRWRLETDEEEPNGFFKLLVCTACNKTGNGGNYCPNCGARMDLEN